MGLNPTQQNALQQANAVDENPQYQTPPLPAPGQQVAPFDMNAMLQAFTKLAEVQNQGHVAGIQAKMHGLHDIVHPPTRHLGMGGEDITGQKGPYDSGGLDWLHAHDHQDHTPAAFGKAALDASFGPKFAGATTPEARAAAIKSSPFYHPTSGEPQTPFDVNGMSRGEISGGGQVYDPRYDFLHSTASNADGTMGQIFNQYGWGQVNKGNPVTAMPSPNSAHNDINNRYRPTAGVF